MAVSFGIEFEFDVVTETGRVISEVFYPGRRYIPTWYYQDDTTTAVELRSPVFTSIDHAIKEISEQFNYWTSELDGYAPYPVCRRGRSLGQHIHIGRPTRPLRHREKVNLAHAAANIYPFLAAIHAQPLPSSRGLTSHFTAPIWEYGWEIPNRDHFCEISDSDNGTVEFRLFDSNIPQVALVNAWILTKIAEKAFSEDFAKVELDRDNYRRDRHLALRFGLSAIDIRRHLEYLLKMVGDIKIPEYPFLREILYLAVRHRMSPFNIYHMSRADPYNYFKSMFTNPDKFIENLDEPKNARLREILRDTAKNVDKIERLSDLIGISPESRPLLKVEDMLFTRLPRSYVAEKVNRGEYSISRIHDVTDMSVYDVAAQVEHLIRHHALFGPTDITADYVIHSPVRFYVYTVYNRFSKREEILAAIGVSMPTAEVMVLAVDRRYRRLGIAEALIDYVRSECARPIILPVQKVIE
jgi:ribosomal protein S18 acetylase RimI-like enzyme